MKNIIEIAWPNTVADSEKTFHRVGVSCDKITSKMPLTEVWLQIIKDNKIIAEIRESVCDIYGEDEL